MNILREIRRIKKRSVPARILLITIFSVILIINTYAWFNANEPVNMSGLEANITPWDVRYYVDDKEVLDETVTFTIDQLYPGMPDILSPATGAMPSDWLNGALRFRSG